MQISNSPAYGSHLPALEWAVEQTEGPIFEMGAGLWSTPFLVGTGRPLVTYELNQEWARHVKDIARGSLHTWITEAPGQHFGLAFLDGGTDESWLVDRREMFDMISADIILVHDLASHLFCEPWRPWHGADRRFGTQGWYVPEGNPATWATSNHVPVTGWEWQQHS